jgi:hypothetical protein
MAGARRRRALAVGLLALSLIAPGCVKSGSPKAWIPVGGTCPSDELANVVTRCARVEVDPAAFWTAGETLSLSLPDGITVEASRASTQNFEGKAVIWHGHIAGKAFGDATFSVVGRAVVGTIAFDGRMYRLRTISKDSEVIEQLNLRNLPNDLHANEGAMPQPVLKTASSDCELTEAGCGGAPAGCTTDDPQRIDVLVLYTPAALQAASTEDAINAWIFLQVFETNRSYENSRLNQRIRLVHADRINYGEYSNSVSLKDLLDQGDDQLNDAQLLRDRFKADAVVLISRIPPPANSGNGNNTVNSNAGTAGISGLANNFTKDNLPAEGFVSFEPSAYAVVDAGGFQTPEFTFAHELGHLMGAEHNATAASTMGVIPGSSFGFYDNTSDPNCHFMTIMTARESGKCPDCDRLPMWSNTGLGIKNCGLDVGGAQANNRAALEKTAPIISAFRCGLATPKNVWMRDTWSDSGVEPDPTQASAVMWNSPYIWVRNTRDSEPTFPEQHLQQDPIPGEVNYVYVKLHNDGEQAGGRLELWQANTTTTLAWPASFTRIDSLDIPELTAHSTRIVEFRWTPSGNGPFSLIAKWISTADAVPLPEPSDPDTFARNSSNVVWRSLSVVSLGLGTDEGTGQLVVGNADQNRAYGRLVIKPTGPNPANSYLLHGEVFVQLDDGLMAAWERTGYRGSGFKRVGNQLQITDPAGAVLDALALDPGQVSRMRFVFRLPRDSHQQDKYQFDVVQSHLTEQGFARLVGGASFEIQVAAPR